MNTKLFIVTLFAGATLLTSCGGGLSEESKKKVAAFDSTWTADSKMAMAWGDSLNQCVSMCEAGCKAGDEMACCEHLKACKDSLMAPCKTDMTCMQDMKTAWDSEMPMWDSLQKQLDGLKEKVANGSANNTEVDATLAILQAAKDKGAAGMGEWMTKFNEGKMNCMKNGEACKAAWGKTSCKVKGCMGNKMPDKKV